MPKRSKEKDFLINILIYGIGNIGSKAIAFLLVPFYTYYITPEDFGTYDIYLGFIFLLIPILTFDFRDGVFRLLLETRNTRKRTEIITNAYRIIFRNLLISILLACVVYLFYPFQYFPEVIGMLLVVSVNEVHVQIYRGLDRNRYYVYTGIFSTLLTGLFSILLVAVLHWGVHGIFWSFIISRVAVLMGLEYKMPVFRRYIIPKVKAPLVRRELLSYSLPLLPSVVCWWILSFAGRLVVLHFLGSEANGIYAVASKLAIILGTLALVIYQAWQDTAIKQYHTPDRDVFFSQIFNNYIFYLAVVLVLSSLGLKIFFSWLIALQYADSFYYIYPCFLAEFFYAMAAFFDLGYQCSKQTRRILPSIYVMTALNILLNILLVPRWELVGVVIASLVSYGLLFVYRAYDTRRYFHIVWKPSAYLAFVILLVGGGIYYCISSPWLLWLFVCGFGVVSFFYLPEKIRTRIKSTLGYEKK